MLETSPFASSLARYVLVGLVAFSLDYAAFLLLWKWAHVPYLLANCAGIGLGFFLSFFLNRFYAFRAGGTGDRLHSSDGWRMSLARFGLANLLSLVFATGLLLLLVQGMGFRPDWSKVFVSLSIPLLNFIMYRHFVFPDSRT
jgi:putative flippase GtrA